MPRLRSFLEWVEFSPFEFGLAKYGVFGKAADFGAKFYKGRLVKKFDEVPLSYLQGKHYELRHMNTEIKQDIRKAEIQSCIKVDWKISV